jgi:hypothetical protein
MSAWLGEKTSVTFVGMPSSESARTAFMPSRVMGIFTTILSLNSAPAARLFDHPFGVGADHFGIDWAVHNLTDLFEDLDGVAALFR